MFWFIDKNHSMGMPSLSRRQFLIRSAAGAALIPSFAALLAACGSSSSSSTPAGPEALIGTPTKPVKLPIYADNKGIAAGLKPEAGPLKILNYADYVSPDLVKAFEADRKSVV